VSLTDAQPDELLRAGAVLAMSGEQAARARDTCRGASVVRWEGPPSQRYQQQLHGLLGGLGRAAEALTEAGDAVLRYARAVADARDLALRAQAAEQEAGALALERTMLAGLAVPVADDFVPRQRAAVLRAQAEQAHALAASQCAAVLRQLADEAPSARGLGTAHAVAGFADGFFGGLRALPSLVGDVAEAVTGDRRAAHRLAGAAKGMLPWTQAEDLLHLLREHDYGEFAGSLSSVLVFRGRSGLKVERYGAHDALHEAVLWGVTRGGARGASLEEIRTWVAHHAQEEFLQELLRLEKQPLPSLERLVSDPVDLVLHEAHGGHTLLRHIGRDVDFLRERQDLEIGPQGRRVPKSSFFDIDEAEQVVTSALGSIKPGDATWQGIQAWLADGAAVGSFLLETELGEPAGLLIDARGRLCDATHASLLLRRRKDGSVYVNTAFVAHP
jgi:hypothetical protein